VARKYPKIIRHAGLIRFGTKRTIQKKGIETLGFTRAVIKRIADKRSFRIVLPSFFKTRTAVMSKGITCIISWPFPIVAPVAYIERGIKQTKIRYRGLSAPLSLIMI
jgi:hypothetical protein